MGEYLTYFRALRPSTISRTSQPIHGSAVREHNFGWDMSGFPSVFHGVQTIPAMRRH